MIKINMTSKLKMKKCKSSGRCVATFAVLTGLAAYYYTAPAVDTSSVVSDITAKIESVKDSVLSPKPPLDMNAQIEAIAAESELEESQQAADNSVESDEPEHIPESAVVENRENILNDYQDLIAEDFHIPENMRNRVGFWFDIYTQHNSHKRLIHHTDYPWIVFEVVDVTSIIESDTPKFRWMRNQKADVLVKQQVEKTKTALKSLSKRKNFDNLTEDETRVMNALSHLDGEVQKKAKFALDNVRVQMGQRNFFQEGLEVSPKYLPGMEEIFENYNLPVELTRLPFVESSFNKHAKSKVGASGIWQFMGNTGKKFMVVTDHIDERTSPFKASVAAAQLLKENHMILKRSWPLAITAWNHGPPGMRKAMAKTKTQDLGEIVDKYRSRTFDFASSNFYSEFLGALFAERYHKEIYKDVNYAKQLNLHTVKLSRSINAKDLMKRSKLSEDDFMLFNPDLKKAVRVNAQVPSGFMIMLDDDSRDHLKNIVASATLGKKKKVSKPTTAQNEVTLSEPVANEL
ncbi:lytic transglycosylase domain-containing protein [Bdellovibrio sp. HCB288]|uniref:lytic transglycosylase domain-containing protein n=1 Tax=Bdellovibrio sp. HCB288 TaxID=3394355 RepID=UPI0039B4FED9